MRRNSLGYQAVAVVVRTKYAELPSQFSILAREILPLPARQGSFMKVAGSQ
jgi:hypothetical protein